MVTREDKAQGGLSRSLAHEGDALDRITTVAGRVAEAEKPLISPPLLSEHRLKGIEIRVNVGNNEYFHRIPIILYIGMAPKAKTSLKAAFTDRFASEWKLLSETEAFLSNTPDFPAYEAQFKAWRSRIQKQRLGDTELITLRSEIVTLRKSLRLLGYDLSLGLQRLTVKGFRNDDAIKDGFARVVICFCGSDVFYKKGSANHVTLAAELTDALVHKRLIHDPEFHYLWYRRDAHGLTLSGAATETERDFIRLENRARANPMRILSALKTLT